MSTLGYVIIFFLFSCSYSLGIASLLLPKWITHIVQSPHYLKTNYGLFKLCQIDTGECRPFPRIENEDCEGDGFCPLWQAAGAGMIVSALIGTLALVALLGIICSSNKKRRERGWIFISGMIFLHAVPLAMSFSIVAYLSNSSSVFYSGTKYDQSFIMVSVSWCMSLVLALSMLHVSVIVERPPDYYAYERLE